MELELKRRIRGIVMRKAIIAGFVVATTMTAGCASMSADDKASLDVCQ